MIQHLLILGVLTEGRMHGYKLYEYVNHAMGMYTDFKKPTLYYALEKLEHSGYISKEFEKEGKRPERRVYQITGEGKKYFLELLREYLRNCNQTYFADDIGIVFMNQLPTNEVRQLLEEKQIRIQELLHQFQTHPEISEHQDYIISHNILHLKADLKWFEDVLYDLK